MNPASYLDVNIATQRLTYIREHQSIRSYAVSTAKNGPGELNGSECTPRGWHKIRAKIGAGAANNTVFIGRRATGEIYTPELKMLYPERDWILTRILWLSGQEVGFNRLGRVDTMRRYIYIHGCPDDDSFALPSSHGCVKMRNKDIIELYELVPPGYPVYIHE